MLLHDHDPTLQDQMSLAMRFIFEHGALPIFIKKRNHVHILSHSAEEMARSIARSVHYEEAPSDSWGGTWKTSPWRLFHDEVFRTMQYNIEDRRTAISIIDPSQWHPHLVSLLLKLLVKFLYCRLHPSEMADDPSEIPTDNNTEEDLIPYITQCLPYAYPTRENLEAIVAIAYLYPQVAHSWNPPDGFWGLFVEFLWVSLLLHKVFGHRLTVSLIIAIHMFCLLPTRTGAFCVNNPPPYPLLENRLTNLDN